MFWFWTTKGKGGFATGDKAGDAEMLKWLCSKGYVAAGINYTLRDEAHPETSVYSQSVEIKEAMPVVVEEAAKLGYNIDKMAISGGSAGGCLALLYAYRDGNESPVPVNMVFEAVGPSCFYPEDWTSYGFDQDTDEARAAAAGLFSVMAYGAYDTFQPYLGSLRLNKALEENGVDHVYLVMVHSGYGLQNDNKEYVKYMNAVEEYLAKYMPVEE